ncbi:hypothetical protein [Manitoba virus]|uniref:Uncharacterized protein n=1 Tax=Manitoba virus TaxID=1272949 RepID=A0A0D3R1X8_9RHAB|nr:hypothetical protein [Manitoba virus]AJR28470.1 hypothetical protein [Manitoba virus]
MNISAGVSLSFNLPKELYKKEVLDRLEWNLVLWFKDTYHVSVEIASIIITLLFARLYPQYTEDNMVHLVSEIHDIISFDHRSRREQYPGTALIGEKAMFKLDFYWCTINMGGFVTYPSPISGKKIWELWYGDHRRHIKPALRREIEDASEKYNYVYLIEYW